MVCSKCGQEMELGLKFCTKCGAKSNIVLDADVVMTIFPIIFVVLSIIIGSILAIKTG